MMTSRFLRILWASPCSLVGLALGAVVLLFGGSVRQVGCALYFARPAGRPPSGPACRGGENPMPLYCAAGEDRVISVFKRFASAFEQL